MMLKRCQAKGLALLMGFLALAACGHAATSQKGTGPTPDARLSATAAVMPTPQPTPSALPDAEDAEARAIVASPHTLSFSSSVDGRGDLVTVWSQGYRYRKPTAVAVRTSDGQTTVHLGAPGLSVVASLPEGWLTGGEPHSVLTPEGKMLHVAKSRHVSSPRAGDIALAYEPGGPAVYRPTDRTIYPIDEPRGARGSVVTRDGALLTMITRDGSAQVARLDGSKWTHTTLDSGTGVAAGGLTGEGDNLVGYTTYHPGPLGDDAEDPVHLMLTSVDGGRTWHTSRVPDGLSVVLSMTVTAAGTGFLSTGLGPCSLVRTPPQGASACVRDLPTIQTFSRGNHVYSTFFGRAQPYELRTSSDQGMTWRKIPPPGRD